VWNGGKDVSGDDNDDDDDDDEDVDEDDDLEYAPTKAETWWQSVGVSVPSLGLEPASFWEEGWAMLGLDLRLESVRSKERRWSSINLICSSSLRRAVGIL